MSFIHEEELENKKPRAPKKTNTRDISNIKSMMDKRKEHRTMTIYNLANNKFQNALIIARQLLFTSQKIWKEFTDEFMEEFEETYFFRTSKNKEHTEYLLDSCLICKVYIKSKKKDDILEMIEKIEIPEVKVILKSDLKTKQDKIEYNEMKEILSRTCAALITFIDIARFEKCADETEKLYHIYTNFVHKYYGLFEYATSVFQYANYLYESEKYAQSLNMYQICEKIRKQNCLNEGYVDVLVNSAVCMNHLGRIKPAIEKMNAAIEISKDLKKTTEAVIDEYHLFLAKLLLQNGQFKEAYKNYLIAYKLRSELALQDPERVEIEINLLFFFSTLKRITTDNTEDSFHIKERQHIDTCKKEAQEIMKDMEEMLLNREEFFKYDDFNKKMAHLTLKIEAPFFELLSSEQVEELNNLQQKLGSCSFPKGLNELQKSSFYNEKKTKDLLNAANPILLEEKAKK